MKLAINGLLKRLGISLVLGLIVQVVLSIVNGSWDGLLEGIVMYSFLAFIPVTIIYAAVTTFYADEEETE